jgi:hypothetical protein
MTSYLYIYERPESTMVRPDAKKIRQGQKWPCLQSFLGYLPIHGRTAF